MAWNIWHFLPCRFPWGCVKTHKTCMCCHINSRLDRREDSLTELGQVIWPTGAKGHPQQQYWLTIKYTSRSFCFLLCWIWYIDKLVQERCNSIANALELIFLALTHVIWSDFGHHQKITNNHFCAPCFSYYYIPDPITVTMYCYGVLIPQYNGKSEWLLT